ncbi:MAG: serine/threonine protein kinase [Polyangiaceae bacterium]|nr:serine/threonine protein kinase [Polyangiaceae bacterium]
MRPLNGDLTPERSRSTVAAGGVLAGRYTLVSELGRGAVGVVWAGVDVQTSQEFALKILSDTDIQLRKRLLREGRVCRELRHKHVARVFDVGETADGMPFLVMERLHGETLAELLERTPKLPDGTAASIGLDIASALEAAHAVGIVHRDLKPANVFMHRPIGEVLGVVKVLDFGVCKIHEPGDDIRTEIGAPVGSLAYMAPEQAEGDPDVDGRADIWSLGVILFEMAAGKRLFTGSRMNVIRQLLYDPLPRLGDVAPLTNPQFASIVDRCLERDREQRWSTVHDVVRALNALCSHAERHEGPRTHVQIRPSSPRVSEPSVYTPNEQSNAEARAFFAESVRPSTIEPVAHLPMGHVAQLPLDRRPDEQSRSGVRAVHPPRAEVIPPGRPTPAGTVRMGSATLRMARDEALGQHPAVYHAPPAPVAAPVNPQMPQQMVPPPLEARRGAPSADVVGPATDYQREPSGLAAVPSWLPAVSIVALVVLLGLFLLAIR